MLKFFCQFMLTNINKWIVKCCLNDYANIMLFLNKRNGMTSEQFFFLSVLWFWISVYFYLFNLDLNFSYILVILLCGFVLLLLIF